MADGPDRSSNRGVVVVALSGLLATLGAAFLGGLLAQNAAETQLWIARHNALQDARREIYTDFLRATATACSTSDGSDEAAANAAVVGLLNAQARVLLIAGSDTKGSNTKAAVDNFSRELLPDETSPATVPNPCELAAYRQLRQAFVTAASKELEE